jgi:deoxyribodipyrimidine photo-lyase
MSDCRLARKERSAVASVVIDDARVTHRNEREPGPGDYVFYWMQASVRTRENHALEYAVRTANDLGVPVVVGFGIDPAYEEATPRTMRFLAEGLADAAAGLARRNIGFVLRSGHPRDVARELAAGAAAVVFDRNYLRAPRSWRRELADGLEVACVEVESNVVVPVETASDKREWAARTIRPKLHEQLDRFLVELRTTAVDHRRPPAFEGMPTDDAEAILEAVGVDPVASTRFSGGAHQAHATLDRFIKDGLARYDDAGTSVTGGLSSHLSMYLHYGHISPATVVRRAREAGAGSDAVDAFVEEVLIRRELAHNYVWYEADYDSYRALPDWAQETLRDHRDDAREDVYTADELENAQTHDRSWNAAMIEMRETGYLHNRMRMYWGKQILNWTNTPEYAYRVALELNNRYLLDGRDANSYANIGWLFGLHDQAFAEREVIGKVRPMTRSGLDRKIDVDAYVAHVEDLTGVSVEG